MSLGWGAMGASWAALGDPAGEPHRPALPGGGSHALEGLLLAHLRAHMQAGSVTHSPDAVKGNGDQSFGETGSAPTWRLSFTCATVAGRAQEGLLGTTVCQVLSWAQARSQPGPFVSAAPSLHPPNPPCIRVLPFSKPGEPPP